jgi:hypothetical protein
MVVRTRALGAAGPCCHYTLTAAFLAGGTSPYFEIEYFPLPCTPPSLLLPSLPWFFRRSSFDPLPPGRLRFPPSPLDLFRLSAFFCPPFSLSFLPLVISDCLPSSASRVLPFTSLSASPIFFLLPPLSSFFRMASLIFFTSLVLLLSRYLFVSSFSSASF